MYETSPRSKPCQKITVELAEVIVPQKCLITHVGMRIRKKLCSRLLLPDFESILADLFCFRLKDAI